MKYIRKYHRYVALVFTLPLIITTLTGIILQLRDKLEFIQPTPVSVTIEEGKKFLTLEEINQRFRGFEQIMFRPSRGALMLQYKDGKSVQLHPQTGEILKTAVRRTNFLIDLHQGSWMGKFGEYFIHTTAGFGLLFLIVSGLIIVYPRGRRKNQA